MIKNQYTMDIVMEQGVKYLNDLCWSYRSSRVLQIANKLDIFTMLSSGAQTAEQLQQKCNAKLSLLEKFLIASAAMGLVAKHGSLYSNTELAGKFLVKGKALYQGSIIAHSAAVWRYWDELEREICPADAGKADDGADHRNFIMAMRDIAVGGRVEIFLESVDLSNCRKLLDVGGGPGIYSIYACKKYPNLKATVFDLPETIKITKEIIAEYEMEGRVSVRDGDWIADDYGKDNDAILFSNVLHGPESQTEIKLKKAYEAMTSPGLLIIQEFLLNDDKTGPLISALFNLMVGAYSLQEILDKITKAGFKNPRLITSCEEIGASWITANKP